jgi:hypothetical protein
LTEIERIANSFAGNIRDKDATRSGWGQFITGAAGAPQIGLYGTCAGLICLGYAGRAATPAFAKVREYLDQIWLAPEPHDEKYFSQTARLAFFVLALNVFPGGASPAVKAAAVAELRQRRFANGLWPAWHLAQHPNQKSSAVATSLALLALAEEAATDQNLQTQLIESAMRLSEQLPAPESGQASSVLPLCAIVSTVSFSEIPNNIKKLMHREVRRVRSTADIEFEFIDFGMDRAGALAHGRDYFYVPAVSLQLYLASKLSSHWVIARQNAERLEGVLNAAVGQAGFQRENSDHLASLDQAWTAWALTAAKGKAFPRAYGVRSFFYGTFSSPGPFLFRDFVFPLVIGAAAALANQNPNLLIGPACYVGHSAAGFCAAPETAAITNLKNGLQGAGILIGFIFGTLFIWRITTYVKDFARRVSR